MFSRLIKEPLLHFFLLGAGVFAFYAVVGDSDEQRSDEIVVTTGQVERLVTGWTKTRMRPPTQAELEALIDEFVREEVYYREALAMSLDRDDVIIRRRLRQKMEFVTQDLSEMIDPTEEELVEYLSRNGRVYQVWRTADPADPNSWVPVGPVETGDETMKSYLDPATDPAAFFKVGVDMP